MCLVCRREVDTPKILAFKIFALDKDNRLQSPFLGYRQDNLYYLPGIQLTALSHPLHKESPVFFAFDQFCHAVTIARQGTRKWFVADSELTVLPVTLYNVVARGYLEVPEANDAQCLRARYPALESKKLTVHDSAVNRAKFYDEVRRQYWEENQANMGLADKCMFVRKLGDLDLEPSPQNPKEALCVCPKDIK